uniref:ABC transmembrane type-1 domain-containing protein n=1 Tax=Panagrolaimus davidi TaxID=227884 RepID=A0A914PB08_9BILA
MPSSTNSDHNNSPARRKRKNGSLKPKDRESRSNSLHSKPKDGQSTTTSTATSPSHHNKHHSTSNNKSQTTTQRPKSTGTHSRSSSYVKTKTAAKKDEKKKQIESMKNGNKVENNVAAKAATTIEIDKTKEAALPPFVWLVMGDFVTFAIEREEVKQNKTHELNHLSKHGQTFSTIQEFENTSSGAAFVERQTVVDQKFESSANPVFIAMFSLSIATFLAAFLQRLAWEWSGIRQVFRVKKAYIKKLLNMDVAWLESRHSGQVASMLHE